MQDLGTLGGHFSEAVAVNAAGQVVGTSNINDSEFHAFLWTRAEGMQDLGSLDGCLSMATAINDLGHVIGESASCDGSSERAFLWTKADGMKDLGPVPGLFGGLTGINIFNQVVGGFCPQPCDGEEHAFIWTKNTGWLDLNDLIKAESGWVLLHPYDINEWGQIAGYGLINDRAHAFLLTPNISHP